MNRSATANVCHTLGLWIGLGVVTGTSSAQILTNGGFEIGGGLYTNTANTSQVTTGALKWTQFNYAFRVKDVDVVPNPDNPAADTNAVFVGAHGGSYAFQCYGPFGNWDASGAYQVVTNGVSGGQTWILNGYGLNWSGDPMTNLTVLAQQFGLIQLVFKNASGTTLATIDGPHLSEMIIVADGNLGVPAGAAPNENNASALLGEPMTAPQQPFNASASDNNDTLGADIGPNVDTGTSSGLGFIRWRHGGNDAANFLFCDGHVETLGMTQVKKRNLRYDP